MFAAKDRPPQDAAVSSRPLTLAAPARISSSLRQESQMPPCLLAEAKPLAEASLFSRLHTISVLLGPRKGIRRNLSGMNTYAKRAANPCGMRTSKIIGLKVSWNEHLRKMGGGGGLFVTQRLPGSAKATASEYISSRFPTICALSAPERKSTPLFSCVCARFGGNGGGVNPR